MDSTVKSRMSCDLVKRWSLLDTPCELAQPHSRREGLMEGTVHLVTWSCPAVRELTVSLSMRYVHISLHVERCQADRKSLGEFILTHPEIKIPSRGKIYSFNEGNSQHFYPPTNEYLNSIKFPSNNKPYSARYIGSMVADVHRTLLYGGIFGYPDDKKSKDGKLRMLYEAFPMSFLIEQVSNLGILTPARARFGGKILILRLVESLQLETSESLILSHLQSTVDVLFSSVRRKMSRI